MKVNDAEWEFVRGEMGQWYRGYGKHGGFTDSELSDVWFTYCMGGEL